MPSMHAYVVNQEITSPQYEHNWEEKAIYSKNCEILLCVFSALEYIIQSGR